MDNSYVGSDISQRYNQTSQPTQSQLKKQKYEKLMPYRNTDSIASYYCGIFGLIPIIGIPCTFLAIFFGHRAMAKYKQNPTPGTKGHALAGLILGYLQLSILLLIFITIVFGK